METKFYACSGIVRMLYIDYADFSNSLMIDVDIDNHSIRSIYDASKQFDSDFIKSFINILRVSTSGFKSIADQSNRETSNSSADRLVDEAIKIAVSYSPDNSRIRCLMPKYREVG